MSDVSFAKQNNKANTGSSTMHQVKHVPPLPAYPRTTYQPGEYNREFHWRQGVKICAIQEMIWDWIRKLEDIVLDSATLENVKDDVFYYVENIIQKNPEGKIGIALTIHTILEKRIGRIEFRAIPSIYSRKLFY